MLNDRRTTSSDAANVSILMKEPFCLLAVAKYSTYKPPFCLRFCLKNYVYPMYVPYKPLPVPC